MSKLDRLNCQVTTAILELEKAERKVSHLEEEIAKLTHPSSTEGRIARRGAVGSAIAGREKERAQELVKRFLAEDGIDKQLSDELKILLR
jgi:hypothetical protein